MLVQVVPVLNGAQDCHVEGVSAHVERPEKFERVLVVLVHTSGFGVADVNLR